MAAPDMPAGAGMAAALRRGCPDQPLGHDLDLVPAPARDAGPRELRPMQLRDGPLGRRRRPRYRIASARQTIAGQSPRRICSILRPGDARDRSRSRQALRREHGAGERRRSTASCRASGTQQTASTRRRSAARDDLRAEERRRDPPPRRSPADAAAVQRAGRDRPADQVDLIGVEALLVGEEVDRGCGEPDEALAVPERRQVLRATRRFRS